MHQEPYIPNEQRGRALYDAGADIAGSAAGAWAGLFVGGPDAVIAGAAVGTTVVQALSWTAAQVGDRLSGRGRDRAMGAVIYTADRLKKLIEEGSEIRHDGFFDETPDGRNAAREVAEGVLLTARDAFEERKVRHIGYLFANVAVNDQIDAGLAGFMLRKAEALTWRQFVLLALVAHADEKPLPDGDLGENVDAWHPWGVRRELRDLYDAGYVSGGMKKIPPGEFPVPNRALSALRLAHQGVLLHSLLSLNLVPNQDAAEVRHGLRLSTSPNPDDAGLLQHLVLPILNQGK